MTRRSVCPRLEVLECRDAPSGLQTQINTVNSNFSTLQNDVNFAITNPSAVTSSSPEQTVNSDLVTLQSNFNSLKTTTTNTQNFVLLFGVAAFESGQIFNPVVDLLLFSGQSQVNTAKNLINSLPGQVSSLGNQTGPNTGPFTFNQINQIVTGAPPLALS
jgi:hypothetical protein